MMKNRRSGVLLHVTSLPNDYGIGTLGREAYEFVDFLVDSGQSLWQILPLGPTGYGNSPYQCFSTFAGNPLVISLEKLVEEELLTQEEIDNKPEFNPEKVDFELLKSYKEPLLRLAFSRFKEKGMSLPYLHFCDENRWWLDKYADFMGLKKHFGDVAWYDWWKVGGGERITNSIREEGEFHRFMQYVFFAQWWALKMYANGKGISIVGDLPIYVASDSADVYSNRTLFMVDGRGRPTLVAGVPPDYFSETGQLWGNVVYRWASHKSSRFRWWIRRVMFSFDMYDVVRIDHFRGLCAFWAVPIGEETAVNGSWIKAEGRRLFRELKEVLPVMNIIAEDLGVVTDDVVKLRDDFGLPGMKILQFAFDAGGQSDASVYRYPKNCVAYTGTHDNDTLRGWLDKLNPETLKRVQDYVGGEDDLVWKLIRLLWGSVADTVIIPMQDLLGLGSEARMNTPSTIGGSNWEWRVTADYNKEELKTQIRESVAVFGRGRKQQ